MEIPHDQRLEQDRYNFFQRLEQTFYPETQILILNAYDLATHFHAGDVYGGGPYEAHVLGVATKCMDGGFTREQDAPTIAAAFLHDVPEKHGEELITYARNNLRVYIPNQFTAIAKLTESDVVAKTVMGATNTPKDKLILPTPYDVQTTGYHGDLAVRLLHPDTPTGTIVVKTFDVAYNVEHLHSIPADTEELKREKIEKRIIKYTQCIPILRNAYTQRIAGNEQFTTEQQQVILDAINSIEIMLAKAGIVEAELARSVGKLLVAA